MRSALAARESAALMIDGRTLEACWLAPEREHRPTIVLLHEALGSLSLWKDFPERLAQRTGCGVLAYSRYGHGHSEPLKEKRNIGYIHHEGEVVLPELLAQFGISRPILLGHSDGASIALIYAGKYQDNVSGLVLEAPHVFVEDATVSGVVQAGLEYETALRQKLSRHHQDADGIFRAWHDLWINPRFQRWTIESYLPTIACPALLIQGEHDGYGTMAQLQAIQSRVSQTEICVLPGCGHSPHREQPDIVLSRVAEFISGTQHAQHGRSADLPWAAAALMCRKSPPSEIHISKVNAR